jgi:hypothetical protein
MLTRAETQRTRRPMRSLALRPGDLPTAIGWPCRWASGHSVSLLPAIQARGASGFYPRRDFHPQDRASLCWSHTDPLLPKGSTKHAQTPRVLPVRMFPWIPEDSFRFPPIATSPPSP